MSWSDGNLYYADMEAWSWHTFWTQVTIAFLVWHLRDHGCCKFLPAA